MFRSSRSSLEFSNRHDAGKALAERLKEFAGRDDVVVLALPRGGVPVAYEVARALDAPLDVFVVRKLGVPGHEELAMGAIASGDVRVLNQDVLNWYGLSEADVDAVSRATISITSATRAIRNSARRMATRLLAPPK